MAPPARRVAVVGLGSIGTRVATALDQGIDGLVLSAISIQDPAKHGDFLAGLQRPPPILPIDGLCRRRRHRDRVRACQTGADRSSPRS